MYMHILVHYGNLYCIFFKFVKFKMNKNELRMQVLVFVRNNPCLWNVKCKEYSNRNIKQSLYKEFCERNAIKS